MKIVIKFNANTTLVVFDFEGFPIVGPFSLHYFGSGKGNIRDKIPLNEWWRKQSVVEQEYLSGSLLFGTNARKRQNNACQLQTRPKIIHHFDKTCILDIFQKCVS